MNLPTDKSSLGAEAFAVFEKKLASEIAIENTRIENNIKLRSKQLYAHISDVELRTLDGTIIIPFQGLDTAVLVPGGWHVQCMVEPGQTASTLPLQKLARDEETKSYVSNQCAGNFPAVCSHPDISDVNTEEKSYNMRLLDDGGTLALFGKVTNLSDEDFQTLIDRDYRSVGNMLQMGREWTFSSPDAIFTPTHVSILILGNGHPGVKKSIQILQQHHSSRDVLELGLENLNLATSSPIEEERKLVFSVSGNPHSQELMESNKELKLEQKKLDDIQDIIRSIEIADADGNSCCRLLNSHGIQIQGKGLVVMVQSNCGFIDMSNFHEIKLIVSGVCLRKASGSFDPYDDGRRFQIHIDYDTDISVTGCLDLGQEFDEPELEVMTSEVLPNIIQDVLQERPIRLQFPPPCSFSLLTLNFKGSWLPIFGEVPSLLPSRVVKYRSK